MNILVDNLEFEHVGKGPRLYMLSLAEMSSPSENLTVDLHCGSVDCLIGQFNLSKYP